ncbi:adenine phosphoribosyltransferase [Pedobacter insulae]|uniref:Adenine phosphoribosyltransferase n=1 Tax=Pedobacter insulae TaxID=414048 RepID=A0A1I2XYV4_9SPHI|nr:adenine phosphoribosyltransferase [Pedobacter insulae]SFH18542.1 adenine phosphoribosyltransferase [Pedobacter insulae]
MLAAKIKATLRDVPNFPKPGIIFKDITPILKDPALCGEITSALVLQLNGIKIDVVAGIESRGFLFGLALAQALDVPFVPIRKAGKLPYKTIQQSYELEYGSATLEVHEDAFGAGLQVLIHDDLLATGGTVVAASQLVEQLGAQVAGYSFLISLGFLNGKERLSSFSEDVYSLVDF